MIPYNPSSFDTNKTLLENILELKKWLQAHPSYEVFYSSANGDTSQQQTYNTSTITDPTNLEAGDVVVFANTTLGNVIAVDSDLGTFTCDPCVSFKGPQGATGSTGPQGVSITNVVVDASNHLIISLSDGNTIDAGAIQYSNYIVLTTTSGTLTDAQYNTLLLEDAKLIYQSGTSKAVYSKFYEDNLTLVFQYLFNDIYQKSVVHYFTITKSTKAYLQSYETLNVRVPDNLSTAVGVQSDKIPITDGNGGFQLLNNEGAYNLSTGASAGQVLTADGSGYSAWQSIPAQTPEGTSIKSTGETSGKVLTADGSGGASWQTAGGGQLYQHNICVIRVGQATGFNIQACFILISNSSTLITKNNIITTLTNLGYNNYDKYLVATGIIYDNTDLKQYVVFNARNYNGLGFNCMASDNTQLYATTKTINTSDSALTISDTVITL